MPMYNHAFDIAFEVVSSDPKSLDITPADIKIALLKRINQLDATITKDRPEGEWLEAIGAPIDTYEIVG